MQDEAGTLAVGKKADVILIDQTAPHMAPTHHLLRTVVMCATPHDVQDVIVDGRVLMRDRTLTEIDEQEVISKATEHMEAVALRAGF
jgi:5-methylthioadenosine/S-adenosylhomocysteine deaminase